MKSDLLLTSLEGATKWFNCATPITRETKGRPTLVHFWSINCEVSKSNLPHIANLREHRKREGLRVIAVHLPRTAAEKVEQSVRDASARLKLTEPCAIDNELKLRNAFFNQHDTVPAYYLFDIDGKLRGVSTGASGPAAIEERLDQLLEELRIRHPFCPACELFLNQDDLFCSECGLPLLLPGSQTHPYYERHHYASLPTERLFEPDPLSGQVLDNKYELIARVGEGAISTVYRARRVHIGDEIAVKILLRTSLPDDTALIRFRREARVAAMLHHPSVITIYDFGEPSEGFAAAYIAMELIKGTPLRDLLKSEGQFLPERALRLMRGICAGVGAAHRRGVVHRDLKPENILVVAPDNDYEFEGVRIIDFGFAKLANDPNAAPLGTVVGTPYYMSPEQCLGQALDTRSDVYSLGAMFYEMLSGNRPFTAESVSGIISKQLSEAPPPLPDSLGIPRRVSTAIMGALAKDPDDRPQTATEMARQLQLG